MRFLYTVLVLAAVSGAVDIGTPDTYYGKPLCAN